MQPNCHAEEHSPQKKWKATESRQQDIHDNKWHIVILREPNQNAILADIGRIPSALVNITMARIAHQHSDDMRPPLTIARRVWIALLIGELVMDAMRRNPKHGTTFQR